MFLVFLTPQLILEELFPRHLLDIFHKPLCNQVIHREYQFITRFHAGNHSPSYLVYYVTVFQTIVLQSVKEFSQVYKVVLVAEVDMGVACLIEN